jgi:hypothetical protein
MKGVSTTTLVAILAISLLGMNNVFAQDDNGNFVTIKVKLYHQP